MNKWLRWRLIDFLNWYHGDKVCWPRLVMWAEYETNQEELSYCFSSIKQCEKELYLFGKDYGDPMCWCGKLQPFPFISPRFILRGR